MKERWSKEKGEPVEKTPSLYLCEVCRKPISPMLFIGGLALAPREMLDNIPPRVPIDGQRG